MEIRPLMEFFSADQNSMSALLGKGHEIPSGRKTAPHPDGPDHGMVLRPPALCWNSLQLILWRLEQIQRQSSMNFSNSSWFCVRRWAVRFAGILLPVGAKRTRG